MVDENLARKAKDILRPMGYQVKCMGLPNVDGRIFDSIKNTVSYVGCGNDLSTLFLFENADNFIHQDLGYVDLEPALGELMRYGVVQDCGILNKERFASTISFGYKGMHKTLTAVHGGKKAEPWMSGSHGDIAFNIPLEEKIQALYANALPIRDVIMMSMINLLPKLEAGGLVHGFAFHPEHPENFGLELIDAKSPTYIKSENIDKQTIEELLGYSLEKHMGNFSFRWFDRWIGVEYHPALKSIAEREGLDDYLSNLTRYIPKRWGLIT